MKFIYLKENLEPIVKESFSFAEVLRKLGRKDIGSNFKTVKKYIEQYNIDTSHFTGQRWNKGKSTAEVAVVSLEDILKNDTNFKSRYLLDRLVDANKKEYKCEICGNTGLWNNKPIRLELHHINGDHYDNRLENLQILCPNCHSQTENFRGRGEKRKNIPKALSKLSDKLCEYCGKIFHPTKSTSRFCSRECYTQFMCSPVLSNNLGALITKERLLEGINEVNNISALSEKFGTSKPTIRKYLDKYNLLDKFKAKFDFRAKPVLQYDMNNNLIKEWPSISDAENTLNIHSIGDVCSFKRRSAGGYIWRFK